MLTSKISIIPSASTLSGLTPSTTSKTICSAISRSITETAKFVRHSIKAYQKASSALRTASRTISRTLNVLAPSWLTMLVTSLQITFFPGSNRGIVRTTVKHWPSLPRPRNIWDTCRYEVVALRDCSQRATVNHRHCLRRLLLAKAHRQQLLHIFF